MHLDFITTKKEWGLSLSSLGNFDFIHTFDFHDISKINGEGSPILFRIFDKNKNLLIAYPALKKEIPSKKLYDLGSVYGYGGPLFSQNLDPKKAKEALNFLFNNLEKDGFISLFSRLHPLFSKKLIGIPETTPLGEIVIIEVGNDINAILPSYKSNHRYEIRKALKTGVEIDVDYNCENLLDFINVYQEAMRDLNASEYYQFNHDYFNNLKNAIDFKTIIISASFEGKKIASSMFIITNDTMQYYLSGSLAEYKYLAASKAIIAKAHEIAIKKELKNLILGGGVGSKEDALFKFKKGFSEKTETFYVLKKILNKKTYQQLCDAKGIEISSTGFFPAYRA